ncbi:hypothetical protein MM239_20720 [Belliella sp. DSM 111904]|uniref:Uncharacterized protein n=1 Tax=Belliella filtrata TaxID=2923435 RepID=A0ABS9V5X5_9BACT|nr:hypothetical protein [Belliella filtrata]MCH7411822.1 hypothetical protein [Belliella filtrata]
MFNISESNNLFQPSKDVNATYLIGEEKAFKLNGSELLYPFSKPELWSHLINQGGTIVNISELKIAIIDPEIDKLQAAKNYQGIIDYLTKILQPNDRIEVAKKDIANAQALVEGSKAAPVYSLDTKRTIHHLSKKEGWNNSKIAKELGITSPTVKSAIAKIETEIEAAKAKEA